VVVVVIIIALVVMVVLATTRIGNFVSDAAVVFVLIASACWERVCRMQVSQNIRSMHSNPPRYGTKEVLNSFYTQRRTRSSLPEIPKTCTHTIQAVIQSVVCLLVGMSVQQATPEHPQNMYRIEPYRAVSYNPIQ
jgi:hypothetical protein